jgi:hypothetical protein
MCHSDGNGRPLRLPKALRWLVIHFTMHPLHHIVPRQVLRVLDDQYLDTKLDYQNEDVVIEKLQDVMNNFILWNKQDIFLKDKVAWSPMSETSAPPET